MTIQDTTTQVGRPRDRRRRRDRADRHGRLKVAQPAEQEGREDLALRVAVQPGGCSGLRYQLFFDERSSTVTS